MTDETNKLISDLLTVARQIKNILFTVILLICAILVVCGIVMALIGA